MTCPVITKDRTVHVDESYTLREVINDLSSKGLHVSLGKTLRFYGLKYTEERAFSSKYKQDFNLSESKSMYDIKMKELRIYKDILIGHSVRGF